MQLDIVIAIFVCIMFIGFVMWLIATMSERFAERCDKSRREVRAANERADLERRAKK